MSICINKNSVQYQTLLKRSGLSEFKLEAYCRAFVEKNNRFPNLDELPSANSSEALKEFLSLNEKGYTSKENILSKTGKSSIEESIIDLNRQFSDLEIDIIDLDGDCIVKTIQRPSQYLMKDNSDIDYDEEINLGNILSVQLDKLAKLYGINIIPFNNQSNIDVVDAYTAKGFVYNGDIYINTDMADSSTKVHELLHLLFGSMRYTNPELYINLVNQAENFKNRESRAKYYPNRTRQDLNEELFIYELANYLSGNISQIESLDNKYEIMHTIYRTLDTILMGDVSSQNVDNCILLKVTDVAKLVNSNMFNNDSFSLDSAAIHRITANTKEKLIEEGKLKEYC